MSSAARRLSNLLFAALLFPAASFHVLTGIGRPVGDNAVARGFSPELPAGYAFAIWGPIFALTVVYAIRQALPGQRDNPLYVSIGWATAGSSLANVVWMLLAQTVGNGWWLVVLIFMILAFAVTAFFRVLNARGPLDRFDRWIVVPMTGMLAAWLSAACWIGTASVIKLYDPTRFGLTLTQFAMAVLLVATVFAWSILRRSGGSLWYAATFVWALVAIVVANTQNANGDRIVATAAAGIALLTIAIALLLPVQAARVRAREAARPHTA